MSGTADDSRSLDELRSGLATIQQGHSELLESRRFRAGRIGRQDYGTKTNPAIKQAVKIAETLMTREGD